MSYPIRPDEAERIVSLQGLGLLDARSSEAVDRIVDMARAIFEVEITALTLLDDDRQQMYACTSHAVDETSRDVAMCNYTIVQADLFEVPDTQADPRFAAKPLELDGRIVRYYAGAPVVIRKHAIGALCLNGFEPRPAMDARQRRILLDLAKVAEREIDLSLKLKKAAGQLASAILAAER